MAGVAKPDTSTAEVPVSDLKARIEASWETGEVDRQAVEEVIGLLDLKPTRPPIRLRTQCRLPERTSMAEVVEALMAGEDHRVVGQQRPASGAYPLWGRGTMLLELMVRWAEGAVVRRQRGNRPPRPCSGHISK